MVYQVANNLVTKIQSLKLQYKDQMYVIIVRRMLLLKEE